MNNNQVSNTESKQVLDEPKYYKHVFINYCIIAIIIIGLSFFGFLFKEWIVPVCVSICAVFGAGVMALLIKSHSNVNTESGKGSFAIYLVLRYACMIIGIVISCILVKVTMGSEVNKVRYAIVLVAALPYFIPTISLLITKQYVKENE